MAKYLVTGASGLLGSHLIAELSKIHEVISLGRTAPSSDIRHIDADFADANFSESIGFVPDGIFHLAQSEHYKMFPEAASHVFEVNTQSTFRLLEFCAKRGVKKFLLASSGAVYGSAPQPYLEERPLPFDACRSNFYAASKLSAENVCWAYQALVKIMICRYFFIYGPKQKESMLIPNLISRVINGQPVTLQGDEGLTLNPIYVEDACRLTIKAMEDSESAIFNIAGKEVVSLKRLVNIMGELIGSKPNFSQIDGEAKSCVADIGKMINALGEPVVGLKDGLKMCV